MTSKAEASIKIPNLEELYCINCKVNPADLKDPIVKKSLYHCQIFTCRSLIFTVRCCIASPSIQNVSDSVHVIVSKSFFYQGKLQEHLSKLNIQFSNPEPVHAKLYEACLKYTFTFKIAPFWNSVDKYFLHGPNFLSLPSGIDALEWDILYKADFSILEIIPMKINLSLVNLECLPLTPSIIDNFITNPNSTINSIDLTLFQCPWVYVLPKLTKAKIISVSRTLPKNCPFQTYNDLRSHWKNMYAYRLPRTDHGMLFYEVVFPVNPSDRFTYPEMCILFKKPELVMSDNKTEIAKQFLKDLAANVHSVCGMVVQIGHLFPELDIEYSYKVKRKSNCNEDNRDELTSPFFKTPAESYIVKPVDEKINLSSMFTVRGFDKMTKSMKNHSQRVISIMKNQQTKKVPLTQNNDLISESQNLYVTPTFNKQRGRKSDRKEERFLEHLISLQQNRTPIDNIDNIISYYDIPSMYPTNQDKSRSVNQNQTSAVDEKEENLLQTNYGSNMDFQNSIFLNCHQASDISKESGNLLHTFSKISSATDLKNAPNLSQSYHQNKPIIKKVESVHYDLGNLKIKSETLHGINKSIPDPEAILETSKLFNQDQIVQISNNKTNYSTSNSYRTATDELFQNLKSEDFSKKLNKDILQDTNAKKLFNIEEQKLKDAQTKFEDEFRGRLSNFDSHNLYPNNLSNYDSEGSADRKFEKQLTPPVLMFDSNSKTGNNSKSKWLFPNYENECNNPQYSPSLLDTHKSVKNLLLKSNKFKPGFKDNFSSNENSLFQTLPSKSSILFTGNDKLENMDTSENLSQSPIIFEPCNEMQSKKIFDTHKSVKNLLLKSNNCEPGVKDNLSNSVKSPFQTPPLKSPILFTDNAKLENMDTSENLFECSPIIFEEYNEMQSRKISQIHASDEHTPHSVQESSHLTDLHYSASKLQNDNCDFSSILSESSNESDSDKYESYKQACTEALTLD